MERRKRKDEVNALKKCAHDNIVYYIDDLIDEHYSRIIMEYCEEGDLGYFLRNQRGGETFFQLKLSSNGQRISPQEWIISNGRE